MSLPVPARGARPRALAAALGAALLTAACQADRTLAPDDPAGSARVADPPRGMTASRALLAAVGDAETRLLPNVAPSLRPALGDALGELHAALDAGQVLRSRRALGALRGALAAAQPSAAEASGDARLARPAAPADEALAGADLGAVEMLAAAAEAELAPPGQPAPASAP